MQRNFSSSEMLARPTDDNVLQDMRRDLQNRQVAAAMGIIDSVTALEAANLDLPNNPTREDLIDAGLSGPLPVEAVCGRPTEEEDPERWDGLS